MKKRLLTFSALALFSLPVYAQEQPKPDIVTLSRQTVEASARACSELITAFENSTLLVKELRAERDALKQAITAKDEQYALLVSANAKLEAANQSLKLANESLTKALLLAEAQHAKDVALIAGQEKRKGKKGVIISILKLAGIGGATVACGPYCGLGAAVAIEAVPIVLRGKKGK